MVNLICALEFLSIESYKKDIVTGEDDFKFHRLSRRLYGEVAEAGGGENHQDQMKSRLKPAGIKVDLPAAIRHSVHLTEP